MSTVINKTKIWEYTKGRRKKLEINLQQIKMLNCKALHGRITDESRSREQLKYMWEREGSIKRIQDKVTFTTTYKIHSNTIWSFKVYKAFLHILFI